MKVLFTVNIPSPYRVDFFNELGRLCDLTVLFEKETDDSRSEGFRSGKITGFTPVFLKGISYAPADAFCPQIREYLADRSFDIIVIGLYHSLTGMYAIRYLNRHKIPFLLSSDGGTAKDGKGFREGLKHRLISSADGWLSTGELCDDYLEHYGADKKKMYRYPFTSVHRSQIVDHPLKADEKERLRSELDIDKDKVVIFSAGQFIYRKGYDVLFGAIGAIKKKDSASYANMELYIAGGEPTEEYIKQIESLGIVDKVRFLPYLNNEEITKYYRAADIFALPTREDIWGLVINEAMAAGLPVITTDRCAAGVEMVTSECGDIVPADDPMALADAMIKEYRYAAAEYKIGGCGSAEDTSTEVYIYSVRSEKVLQRIDRYTIENMAQRHMEIFDDYLSDKKRAQ